MTRKKRDTAPKSSLARVLIENLECLAIAIVMALVLKFFLIEAFKIPTGSMQPTIIGDQTVGIYDRVLVNKLSYLLGEPQRWDVSVFKFPLDLSKNYIKRLIGLPEEEIQIAGGEIYVRRPLPDGGLGPRQLARKPASVRDAVMRRVYPSFVPKCRRFKEFFSLQEGRERDGVVTIPGGQPTVLETRHTVRDHYYHGYDPAWVTGPPRKAATNSVGDLRISFTATLQAGAALSVAIDESGLHHVARLPPAGSDEGAWLATGPPWRGDDGSPATPAHEERIEAVRIRPDSPFELSFLNVDDTVLLEVDGMEVGRIEYDGPLVSRNHSNAIRLEVSGGAGRLARITVDRDIFYESTGDDRYRPGKPILIPKDRFFMMGDNTQNSWDSRYWTAGTFDDHGRAITGNWFASALGNAQEDANPRRLAGGRQLFHDIYGEPHILPSRTIAKTVREPFVKREYLLGKAMAVFWPIPPFSPTFQCKLLR